MDDSERILLAIIITIMLMATIRNGIKVDNLEKKIENIVAVCEDIDP
jgi:hypothetical protein